MHSLGGGGGAVWQNVGGKEVHREAETRGGGRNRWRRQWGRCGKRGATTHAVAYPGGFSGCPETPPAMIFFNQGVTPLLSPTFISHLNLRLLETPLRPTLDTPLPPTSLRHLYGQKKKAARRAVDRARRSMEEELYRKLDEDGGKK